MIVGVPGVYAIETKTWRKPADISGPARATVEFDGKLLRFPKFVTSQPLDQARRNAKTLAAWLSSATGERVVTHPIVTLPGWWVERRAVGDVNVLNPAEIKRSFPSSPSQPLRPEQIQRIAHQLTERCRLVRPSVPARLKN